MRIAEVAPLYESVPPRLYGGTERIVSYLTEELVAAGHQVTLFASGDSRTAAKLVPGGEEAIRLSRELTSDTACHVALAEEVRARAGDFDIIHCHLDLLHLPVLRDVSAKVVTTLHGRLDMIGLDRVYRCFRAFPLISISDSQRRPLPDAHWLATVPHGLPAKAYAFTLFPRGDYLAFMGRIAPEKRVDRAFAIARRTGRQLRIAAKVSVADQAYFETVIRPMLDDPLVEFIGEIGEAEKSDFLGNAAAVLFPIDWPEPFGLVMIEAMACGTPVIAWRNGSVPEVIDDGVTGFIVDDEAGAVAAVARIGDLDRRRLRTTFVQRFSAGVMAARYLSCFCAVLSAGVAPERRSPRARAG